MTASKPNDLVPAWEEDEPDAAVPHSNRPPYFDSELEAWIITKYADVSSALDDTALWPASVKAGKGVVEPDFESHRLTRKETREVLSSSALKGWKVQLAEKAFAKARRLEAGRPLDLLDAYARPLCLSLAEIVTATDHDEASALCPHARIVSEAAAEPYDDQLSERAKWHDGVLRNHFASRPRALGDSAFVAITQTLPAMLGTAWVALANQPAQWELLHQAPHLHSASTEEFLRFPGLVRFLGRSAISDTCIGGETIRKGQKVIMRLIAAHRDPQQFPDPSRLAVDRIHRGNLALGAGEHSCVGASLIRMCFETLNAPLFAEFLSVEAGRPPVWLGGSTFRYPDSVWVTLRRP
jgi:cytochrome P450